MSKALDDIQLVEICQRFGCKNAVTAIISTIWWHSAPTAYAAYCDEHVPKDVLKWPFETASGQAFIEQSDNQKRQSAEQEQT